MLSRRESTLKKRREEYRGYVQQYYDHRVDSDASGGAGDAEYDATAQQSSSSSLGGAYDRPPDCVGLTGPRSEAEQDVLRQIRQDVPRTAPGIPFFKPPRSQKSLERLLYVFAVRHPASSYVQGMNDVATPFYVSFLTEYLYPNAISSESSTSSSDTFQCNASASFMTASPMEPNAAHAGAGSPDATAALFEDVLKDPYSSSIRLSVDQYLDLECDIFWCLSKLLDRIQDNYTFAQPGIQRMVFKLRELIQRIDAPLDAHLDHQSVQYIHFAWRWCHVLLMREFPMCVGPRLWDSYFSEERGFSALHVCTCAALLCHYSREIRTSSFSEMMTFLQRLPTAGWGRRIAHCCWRLRSHSRSSITTCWKDRRSGVEANLQVE